MAHTVTPDRQRQASAAGAVGAPTGDPFDRDVFLLRQKLLRISEKYDVSDEKGNRILYVERPSHLLQNGAALLLATALLVPPVVLWLFSAMTSHNTFRYAGPIHPTLMVLLALMVAYVVVVFLSAKRHVSFYRDASRREKLLEILQDKKWQPITRTFSILDANGEPLGMLAKNWLYNLFRKRWYVYGPDGVLALVAKEDSVILAFVRRFLGTMYGLLRTNFVILRPDGVEPVGVFNRTFTIRDRYVLDMRPDGQRLVDRRVALALGVMLDTGERR